MNGLTRRGGALKKWHFAILLFVSVVAVTSAQETNDLPVMLTVDGRTYSNVTWGAVTPATVSIIHTTGTTTVPLEKLPPELQSRFGYDEAKAKQFRETQMVADIHQIDQDKLHALQGQNLRVIGNKLYDFAALRQLITQKTDCDRKLTDYAGQPGFEGQLNRMLQIDALLGRSSEYCVLGYITDVQGHSITVTDNLLGDYVYVLDYPSTHHHLEGNEIAVPALWTDTRDDRRVYDCGTVPTDEELLSLPVIRVEVK